jgi:serine/threonine protein phosphatase PrpC
MQHCSEKLHLHFAEQLASAIADSSAALSSQLSSAPREEDPPRPSEGDVKSLVSEALRTAFHRTDEELLGTEAGEFVGATAVVAVVGRQHIWLAHCGDSRAVRREGGRGQGWSLPRTGPQTL